MSQRDITLTIVLVVVVVGMYWLFSPRTRQPRTNHVEPVPPGLPAWYNVQEEVDSILFQLVLAEVDALIARLDKEAS